MKNETVLITGASSGIGLELAKCFAADGCRLVLVARNRSALEDLAATLKDKFKIESVVLAADLSVPDAPKQVFDSLACQKISVDVLINNAGFGLHGRFADMPLARQLAIVKVNVTALTELTGLFLPEMLRKKGGGILNVGSVAGFVPGPNMAIYYATKAYVQSFSEALAEELAGSGVSVTVLCPGPTESNFGAVARGDKVRVAQSAKMSAETVARFGYFAFRNRKTVAVPGFGNRSLVFLTRLMPRQTIRRTVKSYNRLKE
ncbi:MAG TPA: SDR family oxidoreductase [Verrucomicrobiae bacterium]|nr:SDR family oxidoreductase [Verrucomicrobiae bacterium]